MYSYVVVSLSNLAALDDLIKRSLQGNVPEYLLKHFGCVGEGEGRRGGRLGE
jgi:hypothetical protein